MTYRFLLILMLALPLGAWAQNTVQGRVFDYDTKAPLAKVQVNNLTNKQSAVSNAAGDFSLDGKQGDILELSMVGYHKDTLFVTELRKFAVYLPSLANNLEEVKIRTAKISPYLGIEDINAGKKPVTRIATDGVENKKNTDRAGGLILNLGFDKLKNKKEKEQKITEDQAYINEIDLNFNEKTVNSLLKIKGEELKDFIFMFKPTILQVKSERPFNYNLYTAQAYQAWLKIPVAQRKPARLN
ncbi:carboxypeptidase-like regulatory domain-containing protein [Pedobacter duraquae]|nr:carboxypeptidase-like regulatory domain-containing protein [Pedobacter duraquae]